MRCPVAQLVQEVPPVRQEAQGAVQAMQVKPLSLYVFDGQSITQDFPER
jgi:hypothetical protein